MFSTASCVRLELIKKAMAMVPLPGLSGLLSLLPVTRCRTSFDVPCPLSSLYKVTLPPVTAGRLLFAYLHGAREREVTQALLF